MRSDVFIGLTVLFCMALCAARDLGFEVTITNAIWAWATATAITAPVLRAVGKLK